MVQQWKIQKVKELTDRLNKSKVIGMLDLSKLPAADLQAMKKKLRGTADIIMTKKAVIYRALEATKDHETIKKLEENKVHVPALIVSEDNPFRLYKTIEKSKSAAPAKGGDVAPYDIVIPAGETPFGPGPMIGELQKNGIKSAIKGDKIHVLQDSTIVKAGNVIDAVKAGIMAKFDIKPMEIGLNVVQLYEHGILYGKDVLHIDEAEYTNNVMEAYRGAFNLAFNADIYLIPQVVEMKVSHAYIEAMNLSINAAIPTEENIEALLAKANLEMMSVKQASGQ
jgi:large subunit ribosomal protein L10